MNDIPLPMMDFQEQMERMDTLLNGGLAIR